MPLPPDSRVIYAEVTRGDVIITFSDGTAAIYLASFLRDALPQAREVTSDRLPITQEADSSEDEN